MRINDSLTKYMLFGFFQGSYSENEHYLILDRVVIPASIIAFIFNIILGYVWWELIIAALVAGGFFAIQYFVSKGKWIGGGDIRLGILMGLMLY